MDTFVLDIATIQQPRTPSELRSFVQGVHDRVAAIPQERRDGMLKKGLYKVFLEEIVPLSQFAVITYSDEYKIRPILGNQGYDAIVLNRNGVAISKIEMTIPHDGAAEGADSAMAVDRGYGEFRIYGQGEEIQVLSSFVVDTARKKAAKDYSGCTLVIVIDTLPPFDSFKTAHDSEISNIVYILRGIQFMANGVFLLISPDRVIWIHG